MRYFDHERLDVYAAAIDQIKEARGYRRFLLRGLAGVAGEWSLLCTGHSLLKLFRFRVAAAA